MLKHSSEELSWRKVADLLIQAKEFDFKYLTVGFGRRVGVAANLEENGIAGQAIHG